MPPSCWRDNIESTRGPGWGPEAERRSEMTQTWTTIEKAEWAQIQASKDGRTLRGECRWQGAHDGWMARLSRPWDEIWDEAPGWNEIQELVERGQARWLDKGGIAH